MHKERPDFNCFTKGIIIEAEESEEDIEAANTTNNNQMSSRGGEASGAAASGRGRDGRPERQRGAGGSPEGFGVWVAE